MATQVSDLEQILQQLNQYGVVWVRNIPEPAELFRDAVLSRLPDGVLFNDVSSIEAVQSQLSQLFGCDSSADAILAALKQREVSTSLLIHSSHLSFQALEYLFSLNAVTDEKGIRLPLLLLETDELFELLRTGNGKALARRIPLSFSISTAQRSVQPMIIAASVIALAAGVYAGLQWWPSQSSPLNEGVEPLAVATSSVKTLTAGVSQASLSTGGSNSLPLLSLDDQEKVTILQAVERWRGAWQSQDWSLYLASYVDQYLPQGSHRTHDSWASFRRGRLEKPAWIKVTLSELKLEILDPYQARVTFWQAYQAPGYADRSFKELRLVRTANSWRIDSERSIK